MEMPYDRKYTYADYLCWDDGKRYELLDGVAYMMSSPSAEHQEISGEVFRQLANHLVGKACRVYAAPFDVRLNADAGDNTVLQPDLLVVCDRKKTENGKACRGAPDMVVEVLSPSSAGRDQVLKFDAYLKAGVREYWMVYPQSRTVQVYLLRDGEYIGRSYGDTAAVPVSILEGCQINLAEVFPKAEGAEA